MTTLIQVADFVNEIALPLDERGVKTRKLCEFINQYEPEFLQFALGNEVDTLFAAGILASTARWTDLRDGVVYTVNEQSIKYGGIKPLIRRYVYYYYTRNEISTTTHVGEKKEQSANATDFSAHKSIQQWNKMSRDIQLMWDFLYECVDGDGERVYPEFDPCHVNIQAFRPINGLDI